MEPMKNLCGLIPESLHKRLMEGKDPEEVASQLDDGISNEPSRDEKSSPEIEAPKVDAEPEPAAENEAKDETKPASEPDVSSTEKEE